MSRIKKINAERVNILGVHAEFGPSFSPYLKTYRVNIVDTTILKYSITSICLTPRKFVRPEKFNRGVIWLKQILENKSLCLPLDKVEIEFENVGK